MLQIVLTPPLLISYTQYTHVHRSSSMPLNQYDTNSYGLHEITHNYDEVHLFQLSFEDVENQNLREAVIPFEMLEITDEIGQGDCAIATAMKIVHGFCSFDDFPWKIITEWNEWGGGYFYFQSSTSSRGGPVFSIFAEGVQFFLIFSTTFSRGGPRKM